MTAPQVEPLKLTLEEALVRTPQETGWYIFHNGVCWMVNRRDHLGFTFEHGSWNEWEGAASHAWGRPVERRDDTAELVEALGLAKAAMHRVMNTRLDHDPAAFIGLAKAHEQASAALARVRGER